MHFVTMELTNANRRTEFEDLFPAKLHYVLEQLEKDGSRDVIAWRSHGKAFLVKDREKFVNDLLPKYVTKNHVARNPHYPCSPLKLPARRFPHRLTLCSSRAALSTLHSWFRQNKWASFQRQLNHYGFQRMTAGTSMVLFLFLLLSPHFPVPLLAKRRDCGLNGSYVRGRLTRFFSPPMASHQAEVRA